MYPDELESLLYECQTDIDKYWQELEQGAPVDQWHSEMSKLLAYFFTIAAIMGFAKLMGYDNKPVITTELRRRIGQRLQTQLEYLANFATELDKFSGNSAIGKFEYPRNGKSRARMYAGSVQGAYWEGALFPLPLELPVPGDGSTECLTNCRCWWRREDIDSEAGDYDLYWEAGKNDHCPTCLRRNREWYPIQVRGGVIVAPLDITDTKELAHKHLRGTKHDHDQGKHGQRNAQNDWGFTSGKSRSIAKGDNTELYRWSNLIDVIDASRGKRTRSLDVTDKPDWYFAPTSVLTESATTVEKVYGRFILDRAALKRAGWTKDKTLLAEGAWRHIPGSIGRTWQDFSDKDIADAYLGAIRGFEIVQLPNNITRQEIADILGYRIGRRIPVIHTNVSEITNNFGSRVSHKHLTGRHDQKTHGNRGVAIDKILNSNPRLRQVWDGFRTGIDLKKFIQDAYVFRKGNISTQIRDVYIWKGELVIEGVFRKDGDRDDIGAFTKTVKMHPSKYGKIRMHHDLVEFFDPKNQGGGTGIDFYRHNEQAYKKISKIEDVTLTANINVGGYAWARVGYQFDTSSSKGRMYKADLFMRAFKLWNYVANKYSKKTGNPAPDFPFTPASFTPHSLAALKAPWDTGAKRFGKQFMLKKMWLGVKSMNDNSVDWKVGQLYYDLRDGAK